MTTSPGCPPGVFHSNSSNQGICGKALAETTQIIGFTGKILTGLHLALLF